MVIKNYDSMSDFLTDGVRKDNTDHYDFDYKQDFNSDVIHLCRDTSGIKKANNLTYYYGYEFNRNANRQDCADFRNALKHCFEDDSVFYSGEAEEFVMNGIEKKLTSWSFGWSDGFFESVQSEIEDDLERYGAVVTLSEGMPD